MNKRKQFVAEFIGTLWLVLCGCGSAIFAAAFPEVGIGLMGVSFAFGLAVLTMAFAVGPVSGAHLNPAVTIGLWSAGRFPAKLVVPYIVSQVLGSIVACILLYVIASGRPIFDPAQMAPNGYGVNSPGGFSLIACFVTELLFTFMFLVIILGATGGRASTAFAPIAIGFALTLIHLVTIPITNTSVNPARSTGPAIFAGADALGQLWMFWVAPVLGGALAGALYKFLSEKSALPDATRKMNPSPSLSPAPSV